MNIIRVRVGQNYNNSDDRWLFVSVRCKHGVQPGRCRCHYRRKNVLFRDLSGHL